MRVIGKKITTKVKSKNSGNRKLCDEIDSLIEELENFNPKNNQDIRELRPDADRVHNAGFYFFNIHFHRTLILIELDEGGEATIVWAGTHQEYESTFKNNKSTVAKWLKKQGYI